MAAEDTINPDAVPAVPAVSFDPVIGQAAIPADAPSEAPAAVPAPTAPELPSLSKRWSVSLAYNQSREIVSDVEINQSEAIRSYCEGMGIRFKSDGTPDTMHAFSAAPITDDPAE